MNQLVSLSLILSFLFLVLGCSNVDEAGYSQTESGLRYKLHYIGEGAKPAKVGQVVLAQIDIMSGDSVLWSNSLNPSAQFIPLKKLKNGGLNEALLMLHNGDSASFIIEGSRLNVEELSDGYLANGKLDEVKLRVRVHQVLHPDSLNNAKEKSTSAIRDEYADINQFFKDNEKDTSEFSFRGIYIVPQETGKGASPKYGNQIGVHYRGYFLSGKSFDNTYDYGQPIEFSYGKDGQVIEGFSIGLSQMNEGGKAAFIIPSDLAFGADGSSTGMVPPNTPVIYEVELVYVKD